MLYDDIECQNNLLTFVFSLVHEFKLSVNNKIFSSFVEPLYLLEMLNIIYGMDSNVYQLGVSCKGVCMHMSSYLCGITDVLVTL